MLMMAQAEASSDDAMMLYKQALAQLGTHTALKMVADLQVAVNGPGLPSHPQLVTGVKFAVQASVRFAVVATMVRSAEGSSPV